MASITKMSAEDIEAYKKGYELRKFMRYRAKEIQAHLRELWYNGLQETYGNRIQSKEEVDELITALFGRIIDAGRIDNRYVWLTLETGPRDNLERTEMRFPLEWFASESWNKIVDEEVAARFAEKQAKAGVA